MRNVLFPLNVLDSFTIMTNIFIDTDRRRY